MLTKAIENAQRKIEMRNFSSRKSVLQYDDVLSKQREIIYDQRNRVLEGEDIHKQIHKMISDSVNVVVSRYLALEDDKTSWNLEGLRDYYLGWLLSKDDLVFDEDDLQKQTVKTISAMIVEKCEAQYKELEKTYGEEQIREMERSMLLDIVDREWMYHMDDMEELKRGINLRAYAQHDPVVEYRIEGFDVFEDMIESIKEETVKSILSFKISGEEDEELSFEQFLPFLDDLRSKMNDFQGSQTIGG